MPREVAFVKAVLYEINLSRPDDPPTRSVAVQFNPETLKLSFSNQNAGGDQRGGSATQFVSNAVTKLSFDLWFDVTVRDDIDDVRKLSREIALFMTPLEPESNAAPPGVRFLWGNFLFEGVMDSMSENLEFFSEDGHPLRASVSVSLSKQEINFMFGEELARGVPAAKRRDPRRALTPVNQGDTAQSVAARQGRPEDWQDNAEANGVDNPRRLEPGYHEPAGR